MDIDLQSRRPYSTLNRGASKVHPDNVNVRVNKFIHPTRIIPYVKADQALKQLQDTDLKLDRRIEC
jgi:hypothetical protein